MPCVSGSVSRAVSGASLVSRSREEGEDGVGMTRAADLWRADGASKTLLYYLYDNCGLRKATTTREKRMRGEHGKLGTAMCHD